MGLVDAQRRGYDIFTLPPLNNSQTSTLSLECLPDWSEARITWGYGWYIHTYGLSFISCLLCTYCCICVAFIFTKWKVYRFLTCALIMLGICGLLRCVYFLYDPYGYTRKIPPSLNRLLLQTPNPALSGAFCALQKFILRLTKLDVGSNRLQSTSFVVTVVLFHFVITFLVETIVSGNYKAKPLLLLSDGYFIMWTSFLSVTFVYNGFKLTHYSSETQRARKELNTYKQNRRDCDRIGAGHLARSSTPQRLLKPRIQITDEKNKTCSILTDCNGTSESDVDDVISCSSNYKIDSDRDDKLESSSDTGYKTMMAGESVLYERDSDSSPDTSQRDKHLTRTSSRILKGFRKTTSKQKGLLRLVSGRSKLECCPGEPNDELRTKQKYSVLNQSVSMTEVPLWETGYMADTESSFTKHDCITPRKGFSSKSLRGILEPGVSLPSTMSSSPSTLSLYRIRQGKMIHKLIVATYVTTFLGFVVSLLHFYNIFGNYGIFGINPQPDPWPWLLFQTFQRSVEFGMGASIGVSGWLVIRYRHQRSAQRKRQIHS